MNDTRNQTTNKTTHKTINDNIELSPAAEQALRDYPVRFAINIAWGEMDAFAHVNNVAYFRYFESARIAYGRRVGMLDALTETKTDPQTSSDTDVSQARATPAKIAPILAATNARYKRPLQFPDCIIVGVKIAKLTDGKFWQQYRIFSTGQDCISTEGEAEIVCFDYANGKKTSLPPALRARIEALEGHAFNAEGEPITVAKIANASAAQ